MYNFKRIIALTLALASLVAFASCKQEPSDESDTQTENTEQATQAEEPMDAIFKDGKTDFYIVFPETPSNSVFGAVRALEAAFEKYGGVDIEIKEEGIDIPSVPSDDTREILIGALDRAQTKAVKAAMPDIGGYAIARRGEKLVICGANSEMTIKAVDYFITTYLYAPAIKNPNKKLDTMSFSEADDYFFKRIGVMTTVKIDGTELEDMKIIVPKAGYTEAYAAEMTADYLFTYYGGKAPSVLTDESSWSGKSIIIGKTSKTTISAPDGEYRIEVTENGIEAVSNSVAGYMDIYIALKGMLPSSSSEVTLKVGDFRTGKITNHTPVKSNDIRVMYHNVLGYVDKYPAVNRPDMTLQIYLEQSPDVIGLQEVGTTYYRAYAQNLMSGLRGAGYVEICFNSQGGTGNPIFYNSNKLTLLESGYARARSGDKGTTWAVFSDTDGKKFAVTNSHFAANSNAGGDATRGNTYRVADAQTLLGVIDSIKSKYSDIPIITGGDFNSSMSSDPGRTLKDGGLVHVTDVADKAADYSAWISYPVYDADKGYYLPRNFVWANISGALDHVMLGGDTSKIEVKEYVILNDRLSCVVSDHLPQMICVDWK